MVIIGAGLAGLAAGCRLAARGYTVEIHEKLDKPGGKAYPFEVNGFTFTCGPSIISAPHMLDAIFTASGRRREEYITLASLNPFFRLFDPGGHSLDINNDASFMLEQVRLRDPFSTSGFIRYREEILPIYEKALVAWSQAPSIKSSLFSRFFPLSTKPESTSNAYSTISKFIQNDFLQDVFAFHPLRLGSNPCEAPISLSLNHHLEHKWGAWYAIGGPSAIVNGLVRLFEELGGELRLNSEVGDILAYGRHIEGIRLVDGGVHRADVVIAACDPATTYTRLIQPGNRNVNRDNRYYKAQYSCSAFVISLGTRKKYTGSNLLQHNYIFGGRLKDICTDIFHRKTIPQDLFLHLTIPSFSDPSIAPKGCESIQVISPVPNLKSTADWDTLALPYRDRIINFLEETYLPGLKANITAEHHLDPVNFLTVFNNPRGSAYSMHFIRGQSGWFYSQNQSKDYNNLYLVGNGTHPGPGLPGALSSALITTRLIEAN